MPKVVVSGTMPNADVATVWAIVRCVDQYPRFMSQVLAVEILEESKGRRRSSWTVLFNGNELRWIEIAHLDDDRHEMRFEQIEGDLAVWTGRTIVSSDREAVLVTFDIEFDLGIPALAALLHPLGERAVRANCAQMLTALAAQMAQSQLAS